MQQQYARARHILMHPQPLQKLVTRTMSTPPLTLRQSQNARTRNLYDDVDDIRLA